MINKNIIAAAALLLFGSAFQANAQTDIAVSGTVKDVYGNPLPGVIVSANHKDLYITDKNGEYQATADRSDELVFSLLGYKQATAKAAGQMEVVLEDDAHNLAQNVNLGFNKAYREVLTDAVSSVEGEVLERSLYPRLQGTFSGLLSGLTTIESSFEPAYEELSLYIRGMSTVHGGAPGVVIDGLYYNRYATGDILYRISPEEVESVSILKDGASQALYGVAGANGIIVINTKRGTPGKLKVGVNIAETVQQPSWIAKCFDSYDYAMLRNQAGMNDGKGMNAYFSEEALEQFKNGGNELYPNTDWYGSLVKNMFQQQRIALDATGGNENVRFYTNFNVARQGGFFKTDATRYNPNNEKYRINFRSNIDIKVNNWISMWMNLAGSIVKAHTPAGNTAQNAEILSEIFRMPSTLYGPVSPQVLDEEGNVIEEGGLVTTTTNIGNSPYGHLNRSGYGNATNTNIYGQAGLNFDLSFITPGLWAGASVGYLSYITATQTTTQSYARYVRTDDWSGLNFKQHGTTIDGTLGYGKGSALYGYLSYKAQMGWARNFGKHHLNADAFAVYQEMDDNTGNAGATYDFRTGYTGAELMYDFDKRYAVKVATGYSASDYYPRATRWIWTPSVAAAWIASNESFIKDNVDWLSLFKIRASYAITGNGVDAAGYDRYAYKDQVTSTPGGNIGYLSYYTNETAYGNDMLEPETIKKANIGIDLGVANQFEVNFDVFQEKQDNGVFRTTSLVPSYQGISLGAYPITNIGQFENKGWELGVSYRKRFNSDFALFAAGHLDYNKNKIIYTGESERDETYAYPLRTDGFPYGQTFGYLTDWSNGNGLFNFQEEIDGSAQYAFGTPRVGDIKYQDLNGDNVIDEKDQAPIAHGQLPRYNFGFNLGASIKNFEINLLFQGVAEYYRNYAGTFTQNSSYDGLYSDVHLGAWTAEKWLNDEPITAPALSTTSTTNSQTNDYFYRNASFLRLKNAEIAYKMPGKVCDFLNASAFKVYVSGQNLFTIDDLPVDMPVEGSYSAWPLMRMYRIGIDITF